MRLKNKSWRSRAGDLLSKYLKLKMTTKAAKTVGKAAKLTAYGKAAKAVAKRVPNKAGLAVVGGVGAAAALAARRRRGASPDPA